MLTRRWDKYASSRREPVGPGRAPHRSYYYAMGLSPTTTFVSVGHLLERSGALRHWRFAPGAIR